jgi:hypothetical protein
MSYSFFRVSTACGLSLSKSGCQAFIETAGAADRLFDAFLSGSLIAPAERRLNCNCVKCELTEQDRGAEHVCMVSGRLT